MAPRRHDQADGPGSEQQVHSRNRPSLIQRISGLLASIPRRRPAELQRPFTVLGMARNHGVIPRTQDGAEARASGNSTPASAVAPCPYDPSILQSFPSFGRENYWTGNIPFTRPRNRSRDAQLTPCDDCRVRGPHSHLAMSTPHLGMREATPSSGSTVRHSEVDVGRSARTDHDMPRAFLESRPRPTRMRRLPNLESLTNSSSWPLPSSKRPPTRRGDYSDDGEHPSLNGSRGRLHQARNTTPSPEPPRSPRLHHIHGLPRAREYPYVHRNEVAQHLAAIRAGASSPVRDLQEEAERVHTASNTSGRPDYSSTVYYTHGQLPVRRRPRRAPAHGISGSPSRNVEDQTTNRLRSLTPNGLPLRPVSLNAGLPFWPALSPNAELRNVEAAASATVREDSLGNIEIGIDRRRVYTLRSPRPRHTPSPLRNEITGSSSSSDDSHFSTGTMPPTPGVQGGSRLELRGGNGLRYSDASECLKSVLSTDDQGEKRVRIHESYDNTRTREWDTTNNTRVVSPEHLTRALNRSTRVLLPSGLYKHGQAVNAKESKQFDKSDPHIHNSNSTSIDQILRSIGRIHHSALTRSQRIPILRGGGHSDRADEARIPPTLFGLSGGRGRPITIAAWNRQKSEKRMGGLFGMAIYGHKAGKPYKSRKDEGKDGIHENKPPSPSHAPGETFLPANDATGDTATKRPGSNAKDKHDITSAKPEDTKDPPNPEASKTAASNPADASSPPTGNDTTNAATGSAGTTPANASGSTTAKETPVEPPESKTATNGDANPTDPPPSASHNPPDKEEATAAGGTDAQTSAPNVAATAADPSKPAENATTQAESYNTGRSQV